MKGTVFKSLSRRHYNHHHLVQTCNSKMATVGPSRPQFNYLILFVLLQMLRPCTSVIQTMSSVLEEVLEHGPLFDEMEDEAWWSGVDVIDTALRSWPESGSISDASSSSLSALATLAVDDEDFCRFWQITNRMHSSSFPPPADACSLMNRALAVADLSAGGSSVFLLPRLPPPPPVPPTLTDLVNQLNQLGQIQLQQQQQQTVVGSSDDNCLLCQWATLNGTIDLLPNSELSSENTWVPMLVVVALVSAMLGAVLMITALKCRRFKVLPRGGSCPTLPVGYMVGEGKEGVVQSSPSELTGMETMPKNYTMRQAGESSATSTLGRPRLETPTMNVTTDSSGQPHPLQKHPIRTNKQRPAETATGWRVKLWRKMTGSAGHCSSDDYRNPYANGADESDDISAVYAELNSIAGSTVHRPSAIYHLNTYSEIREPHHVMMAVAHGSHQQHVPPHAQTCSSLAATLHLRRLLSDGTYENGGYALERGVVLMEHLDAVSNSNGSASTPSSAYYSDLSNSDRSASLHHQQLLQWAAGGQQDRCRPRVASDSHGSSHSLPPHQHCCHHEQLMHQQHHCHHQHSRSLQEQQMIRARDLMPIALQVIPDNQQTVPLHYIADDDVDAAGIHHHQQQQLLSAAFTRGGVSSSMRDDGSSGSCKRPLPPLPSRQQQRPQRRYAYAVDHQANSNHHHSSGNESQPEELAGGGESPALSCVPSEYV